MLSDAEWDTVSHGFSRTLCLDLMVTIGMDYHVLGGKEAVFEGACRKVLDLMREADGHDDSQIFRRIDGGENAQYLIVSHWSDEDAFSRFIASDRFKKVTSWGLANVLAGRPSHTTYHQR
jgi:heme-degrading monooxygenase HmoA